MADEVRLKNGDLITGHVVRMEDEKLILETSYAGKITIKWTEVSNLRTEEPIKVVLSDETSHQGIIELAEQGKMKLKMVDTEETVSFNLAAVKSINPKPPEPAFKLRGHVNVGVNLSEGNTETENYHFDGEVIARTKKNRYTIGGEYDLKKNDDKRTEDNALGYVKYDRFLTKKWYFNSTGSLEFDKFRDIDLRTTVGAGIGYQFYETPLTNLSTEAGLAYVITDYDDAKDEEYPAGRWAINYDRFFFNKFVQFFHFDEGFISLEDSEDIFIRTRTGLRFLLHKNFNATVQYNWDWDNTPAPGDDRVDERVIFTLGYFFE